MLSDNKDAQNISSYSRSKIQFKQCKNDSRHIFKLKNYINEKFDEVTMNH